MTLYRIRIAAIDETFEIEASTEEEAVRSLVRDKVSLYPSVVNWNATVLSPTESRYQCKVAAIRHTGDGSIREVTVSVDRAM